jgi:DNA-binding response OmpR family regulator
LGTPDPGGGGSARPPRLLIVDDEPRVLGLLVDYFREQGYAIEMATAGAAALVAVRERRPDVILLDLNMPGVLDGRAVLRAIGGDIPVIVVTGIDDPDDARTTLQAGAFDFVSKPFDLRRIGEIVAAAVAYRRGA